MLYMKVPSPVGSIHLLAGDQGLCAAYFDTQKEDMERRFPQESRTQGLPNQWLLRTEALLCCYFAGDLDFSPEISLDLAGSPFQIAAWKALQLIRPGATRSYGELAREIGQPSAARAVGAAVGKNPVSIIIPCHRAVGSTGALTGYAGGLEIKRFLLEHEQRHCAEPATALSPPTAALAQL